MFKFDDMVYSECSVFTKSYMFQMETTRLSVYEALAIKCQFFIKVQIHTHTNETQNDYTLKTASFLTEVQGLIHRLIWQESV